VGSPLLHAERGRRILRLLTAVPVPAAAALVVAAAQAKISPPLVSSACPVMARDRSEAR
jgi:hypothetical protein